MKTKTVLLVTLPQAGFLVMVLIAFATGCASSKSVSGNNVPDGFYTKASGTGPGYAVQTASTNSGPPMTVAVEEYDGFVPQNVIMGGLRGPQNQPEYFVQINGLLTTDDWPEQGFLMVANQKLYPKLNKHSLKALPPSPDGTKIAKFFLMLDTRKEAEAIANAMCKRYSLKLEEQPAYPHPLAGSSTTRSPH